MGALLAAAYIRRLFRQGRARWPYLAAGTLVLGVVAYCAIAFRVAESVTRVERLPLEPSAATIAATHEDVAFDGRDGTAQKGWWFAVTGADRAAVIVHGRARSRVNFVFRPDLNAKMLMAHGYSVLLFDLRGHGESGGTRYTLGIEEPHDILAAIDLAASTARLDRGRVAIIGESLGGGSALMTVQAHPSIGPVITDSAFADGPTVVSEGRPREHPLVRSVRSLRRDLWFALGKFGLTPRLTCNKPPCRCRGTNSRRAAAAAWSRSEFP
ncbi:MAG TPA: alpha/beta fold hydrolase [Candidatus Limnocylindria bacterium]|jgi:pimeloyl-ACP methyl ester carboxylesterase|nr:alpha/beta fold hydrolase [Candidatus Limnocylindria bacterium]